MSWAVIVRVSNMKCPLRGYDSVINGYTCDIKDDHLCTTQEECPQFLEMLEEE